jgi:hypothetical protein
MAALLRRCSAIIYSPFGRDLSSLARPPARCLATNSVQTQEGLRDINDFIGGLSLCYHEHIMSRVINIWVDVI